jgi:hypothetical protein
VLLRKIGGGDAPLPPAASRAPAVKAARCLVLLGPPEADDPAAPLLDDVSALVDSHQAELLLLPDGTAVAVVARTESLAAQLAAGARCSLALRALAPTAAIVLVAEQAADGKTQLAARSGVELLTGATPPGIFLSDLAARQMPQPFDAQWAGDRAMLLSSQVPAASTSADATGRDAFVEGVVGGPTMAAPVPAPVPAVQPLAASETFAPASPPAGPVGAASERRTSPGLYVALGALGAFLLALAFAGAGWAYLDWNDEDGGGIEVDDDDESDETEDSSPCPPDSCLPFRPSSTKRFDPTVAAPKVIKAVHGRSPGAQLIRILVSELATGAVDLTADDSVLYWFHLPKESERSSLTVHLEKDRLRFSRTDFPTPFGPQPIAVPKCKLARAWAVACKHGLAKSESVGATYARTRSPMGKDLGAAWELMSHGDGLEMWYVDGATCAWLVGFNPATFSPVPGY